MQLTNPTVIRKLMAKHKVHFTKSLGQNFLIDPSICPQMAELSTIDETVGVLEIGPGIGVLTKELALRAKKVVSIELDQSLLPVLGETLAEFDNISIIPGDVLKINLPELFQQEFGDMPVVVCANLPYYITSPIVMNLLEQKLPIQSITVMIQKEAALRIAAPIPSREVGAITVSIGYYAHAETLFQVARSSFMPAPKVDSSVIKLTLYKEPPVTVSEEADFFAVVRASFAQRRKTIHNSLSSALQVEKPVIATILAQAGVAAGLRAEQLQLEEFAAIANQWSLYKGTL